MEQKYLIKHIARPAAWDLDSEDAKRDIARFNETMSPGLVLEEHDDTMRLRIQKIDMAKLEKAAHGIVTCADLGTVILDTIQSIKSYAYRSGHREYVGYNKERKVAGRRAKSAQRLQKAACEPVPDSVTLPSEYADRIMCGDSQTLLREIPDNCVDLVFTSPPYNFGLEYENASDDAAVWDQYFEKLYAILDECIRVLKHGGRLIVNVQPLFSDYVPTHHRISEHMRERGMLWKGEIIWEKNNYNCKYTAWGSWKSPSSPYLKYTWEFIEIFCKGSLKHDGLAENADIRADDFKQWVNAKWSVPPERKMKEMGHPAMFPEELAQRAIQLFSFRGDVILDPFMGVGTTCAVAKKTGRRYIGIDISKEYVRMSQKRLDSIPDARV